MFDKLKRAARKMAKDAPKIVSKVSGDAPKHAAQARTKLEPYATKAAEHAKPLADKVLAATKLKLKEANRMAQSGAARSTVEKYATTPVKHIAKRTRNWSIGVAFGAIAIFGFSYGLGSSILPSVRKVVVPGDGAGD
jgi:hypothetical protein